MKTEWPFPYPKQVAARALVLNLLRYQPARFQDMVDEAAKDNIGVDEIERAGAWLGVVEEMVRGERVWERPPGLSAIWWSSGEHLFKWRPNVMACA
jgi:hypothetical protein